MAEVLFYHLERASLETVLPGLLEKCLDRSWRSVVRAGSRAEVDALDAHLWTYRDDAFLPHGAGPAEHSETAVTPIWLTETTALANGPAVLFLVGGGEAAADELETLTRCIRIFDGADEDAVAAARVFWKSVQAAGCEATYWRQSVDGRWEKQT